MNGQCAYGNCSITGKLCGPGYGACAPIVTGGTFPVLQKCQRFAGNGRQEDFCQPGIGVCPGKTSPDGNSVRACREAQTDSCTIDTCSMVE